MGYLNCFKLPVQFGLDGALARTQPHPRERAISLIIRELISVRILRIMKIVSTRSFSSVHQRELKFKFEPTPPATRG